MQNYYTVNDIKTETEALVRNITGKEKLTAVEVDIVYSSIIDAYQYAIQEYGVDTFMFHQASETQATTSGTSYIELTEYVYKVVSGSVRIKAENQTLSLIDELAIFQTDPNLDETGCPTHYAYTNSDDPNIVRLSLWPLPDAAYSIEMKVLKFPTDVLTNFPTHLQSAIKNKAKGLAVMGLGLGQLKPQFDSAYEEIMAKIKDGYNDDGPRHIGRRRIVSYPYYKEE